MFKGLRNKFLLLYMGTVVLLIIFSCSVIFTFTYQNIERNSTAILERGINNRPRPMPGTPPAIGEVSPAIGETPPAIGEARPAIGEMPPPNRDVRPNFVSMFAVEFDSAGKVIAIESAFGMEDAFYEELTQRALSQNKEMGKLNYDGATFKYKASNNKIVFLDVSQDEQLLKNMLYIFVWVAIPMLAAIFFISLYFANRSIKPIEASYNKQKEFIADASHELNTPLATIATNVDVLLEGASVDQTKWLAYIKSETERMSNLTGSLLYLAKVDYKDVNEQCAVFDLCSLVNDCLMPIEATFYENKIKTEISLQPDVKIYANSEQIRRMVRILIDNAVKYTDGTIKITLESAASHAKLVVYNTGEGIAKEDLGKIWDRFYRGDKSREYSGGFGLGLSIAKAIADNHKGSIAAESAVNGWTRFIVKIPLA